MVVYVLMSEGSEYPAYELEGVYSTEGKARRAIEELVESGEVTEAEFKIDEMALDTVKVRIRGDR